MNCTACGAELENGAGQCPQCGKVQGEVNRCFSCGVIAGVNEVAMDRYACSACGASRPVRPGTVILSSFAETLEQGARRRKWTAYLLFGTGGVLGAAGLAVAGIFAALDVSGAAMAAVFGLLIFAGHLLTGRRLLRQVAEMQAAALERRLLREVRLYSAGISPERVAASLHEDLDEVDKVLTGLAKRGRLLLDVTDEGSLRYRVAQGSLAPPPPPGAAITEPANADEQRGDGTL